MRPRRGVALVVALFLVVSLTGATLEMATRVRGTHVAAGNVLEHTAAMQAALGGIERVRALLAQRGFADATFAGGNDPWAAAPALLSGTTRVGRFRVQVSVIDAGSRLGLNTTTEDELRRLLAALRVDAGRADRAVQCLLDWRDPDMLRRARGAERADYLRAGDPIAPDDGPFGDVGSLRLVMGIGDSLFPVLAPWLTVAGSGRVNLASAPPAILSALPGMSDEAVATIVALRAGGRILPSLATLSSRLGGTARERFVAALPELQRRSVTSTTELLVTSVASYGDGMPLARAEIVLVRNGAATASWRRLD